MLADVNLLHSVYESTAHYKTTVYFLPSPCKHCAVLTAVFKGACVN